MKTYRILCIDDGKLAERSDYNAEDDREALALFALRGEQTDCELWCGDRLVATIPKGGQPILSAHEAP